MSNNEFLKKQEDEEEVLDTRKKLKIRLREAINPVITVLMLSLFLGFSVWTVNFFYNSFAVIFLAGGSEDYSSQGFNVKEFKRIAPLMGIDIQIQQPSQEVQPVTETPVEQATTTPGAGDITFSVLNGCGKKGVASEVKTFLEAGGFIVSYTGNADNLNYPQTVLRLKESKQEYLSLIETYIQTRYPTTTKETLSEEESFDAAIVIGKADCI